MSMNLNCNLIDLWQTPTHITDMCLMDDNGEVNWDTTRQEAKRALYLYLRWCEGTMDRAWDSLEDLQNANKNYEDHKKAVLAVIDSDNLNVYKL